MSGAPAERAPARADRPITIVALGDSTTAGTPGFRSPLEAPPDGEGDVTSQFAYWLARARPWWRVLNRGVNGERSDQIRARFDRDVAANGAAAVIVIAGVNDIYQGRSAESVQHELEQIYESACTRGIAIVAGTIIPYNTATPEQNARMRAVNEWIRSYASRNADVTWCDTRAAVADPDNPDRLVSSPDGLHPSPEGYKLMADALEPALARALTQTGRMR